MFIQQVYDEHTDCGRAAGSAPRGMDMAFMTVCMIFASVIIAYRALAKPTSSAEYVIVFAPAANDFPSGQGHAADDAGCKGKDHHAGAQLRDTPGVLYGAICIYYENCKQNDKAEYVTHGQLISNFRRAASDFPPSSSV